MEPNGHNPTVKPVDNRLKIEILVDPGNGMVMVNIAPPLLQNIPMCYGLVEIARQQLQKYADSQMGDKRIVPATNLPSLRPS